MFSDKCSCLIIAFLCQWSIIFARDTLREKCPYLEFFWCIFSRFLTEYGFTVNLRIHSECGKIRTRKTPNTDTFHAVIYMHKRICEAISHRRGYFLTALKIASCPLCCYGRDPWSLGLKWNVFFRMDEKEKFHRSFICMLLLFARQYFCLSHHCISFIFHSTFSCNFFFYLSFLSRTFTIRRTARERGGYFFNSPLPLSPAWETLRH